MNEEILAELENIVSPENLSSDKVDLIAYSRDWSLVTATKAYIPDIVVRPRTSAEIAEIMHLAIREKIAVVPWGGGTGLSGGAVPLRGGIVIDMKGLNKVIEIDKENLVVVTQTGITVDKLNKELGRHGLWWPHDPESKSSSTVGAAIACGSVGTFGTKYGGIIDYLLGIEVVLPQGEIVKIGSKAPFSVSGYPLHSLFIGSEGTLGIITEATLRIYELPKYRCIDMIAFNSLKNAINAGQKIIAAGMDPESLHIVAKEGVIYYTRLYKEKFGKTSEISEDTEAVLAISFAGSEEIAELQRNFALRVCSEDGVVIKEREIVNSFWTEKHSLEYEAGKNPWFISARKGRYAGIDLCVPISRIPHMHEIYRKLIRKYNLQPATGYFCLCNRIKFSLNSVFTVTLGNESEEIRKVEKFIYKLAEHAIKFGGTISSCRGVGAAVTRELMSKEHSPEALRLMKKLKFTLDPNDILNPGKKLPD